MIVITTPTHGYVDSKTLRTDKRFQQWVREWYQMPSLDDEAIIEGFLFNVIGEDETPKRLKGVKRINDIVFDAEQLFAGSAMDKTDVGVDPEYSKYAVFYH